MKIEKMVNMSPVTAIMLTAVGIKTVSQLRAMGSIRAYQNIRAAGIKTSLRLLLDIEGALTNTHWSRLPTEVRSRLLVMADVSIDTNKP